MRRSAFAAASMITCASRTLGAKGFSQKTCAPAANAWRQLSTCDDGGVATTTASSGPEASAASSDAITGTFVLRCGPVATPGIHVDTDRAHALDAGQCEKEEIVTGIAKPENGDAHVATASAGDINAAMSGYALARGKVLSCISEAAQRRIRVRMSAGTSLCRSAVPRTKSLALVWST